MHRSKSSFVALFPVVSVLNGARVSLYQRAVSASAARRALSHVPMSQALRLVCVCVGACDMRDVQAWGACRAHPRASALLFPWDIGTVGRKGVSR
jgi:hypothetical protein